MPTAERKHGAPLAQAPTQMSGLAQTLSPSTKQDQGQNLGVTSWPPEAWKIGGGTVWGWISYDPELDLIYHGTGNPGPWNPEQRPGDNKWTSGIFARKPDTGEAIWYYQWAPHDLFDYDGINEQVLLDLPLTVRRGKSSSGRSAPAMFTCLIV
jgi:glucose dehydrogenase